MLERSGTVLQEVKLILISHRYLKLNFMGTLLRKNVTLKYLRYFASECLNGADYHLMHSPLFSGVSLHMVENQHVLQWLGMLDQVPEKQK